jgi:hypothetical protein
VTNRTPEGMRAPAWYRRAFVLALTKLIILGDFEILELISSNLKPAPWSTISGE